MNDLNSVLIEGNLCRDPERKENGPCTFAIAVNRSWKKDGEWQKEVSYFDVTVWGRQGEICQEYLKKGRGVRIVGQLKQDRWEKNGEKKSRVVVVAEHVEFKPERKDAPDDNDIPF